MKLHSSLEPFRGIALATIVSMLAVPLAVNCADVACAEQTSQVDISLRTNSPQPGVAPDPDRVLAPSTLIVKKDGQVRITESVLCQQGRVASMETDHCCACGEPLDGSDRFWLINTRHLTSSVRRANLDEPSLTVYRMHSCSRPCRVTVDHYLQTLAERRNAVVYVHGNRIHQHEAVNRGFSIHQQVKCFRSDNSIDWVIWSWPSNKQGILMHDARIKASRTDGQGLYLAWLLRQHAELQVNTSLIGYSFGGRIITGALHAAAGGALGGRQLPGDPVVGGPFDAGLVAPAVDSHWLTSHGYHRYATQNLERLVLMYNRRDAVLKRYWLIDRVRGRMALGYSGPTSFADRFDGTTLPVLSRDCSPSIGLQHDELDYYQKTCYAGFEMAKLIDDFYDKQ